MCACNAPDNTPTEESVTPEMVAAGIKAMDDEARRVLEANEARAIYTAMRALAPTHTSGYAEEIPLVDERVVERVARAIKEAINGQSLYVSQPDPLKIARAAIAAFISGHE